VGLGKECDADRLRLSCELTKMTGMRTGKGTARLLSGAATEGRAA